MPRGEPIGTARRALALRFLWNVEPVAVLNWVRAATDPAFRTRLNRYFLLLGLRFDANAARKRRCCRPWDTTALVRAFPPTTGGDRWLELRRREIDQKQTSGRSVTWSGVTGSENPCIRVGEDVWVRVRRIPRMSHGPREEASACVVV